MPVYHWARKIDDLSQVPKVFRDHFPREYAGTFPHTVFAPADRWGFRKVHPKLLCLFDGGLSFLELGRGGVTRRDFALADLTCVETGRILLHAWIEIGGIIDGRPASVKIEYSSVVDHIFRPVVEAIRAATAGIPPAGEGGLALERGKLDHLIKLSYKMANFAKTSIMPGERVLDTVFEPAFRRRKFPGFTTVAPAFLALLTDRELIFISDGRHREAHVGYGGIWRYMPLCRIGQLSVQGGTDRRFSLVARLAGGGDETGVFSEGNGEALRRLLEAFEAQKGAPAAPRC